MNVGDIMSTDLVCCNQRDTIQQAAKLMAEHDCGSLPVLDGQNFLVGVITDRDICCRAVAKGKGLDTPVFRLMTSPVITVRPQESVEECCHTMEEHQVRRLPVTDVAGRCYGVVAQADLALMGEEALSAEVIREISLPKGQQAYLG